MEVTIKLIPTVASEPKTLDACYQYIIYYNEGCTSTLPYTSKLIAEELLMQHVHDLITNGFSIKLIVLKVISTTEQEIKINGLN
jgi:hypothetical protein